MGPARDPCSGVPQPGLLCDRSFQCRSVFIEVVQRDLPLLHPADQRPVAGEVAACFAAAVAEVAVHRSVFAFREAGRDVELPGFEELCKAPEELPGACRSYEGSVHRYARIWNGPCRNELRVRGHQGPCLFQGAGEDMLALQRTALGQSALAGRVRVSAPPLLLNYFVLPHLDGFRALYPQIELELRGERRGARLGSGEADIALRMAEPREPDLVARNLGPIAYGLYGTKACNAQPESEWTFIGFDDSMPELPQKLWLDSYAGARRYALRANDMVAMCQAAGQGWGLALLPRFLAARDHRLHGVDTPVPPPLLPVYLVMHADVRRAPRIRSTADYLIEVFARHGGELAPRDGAPP